MGISIRSITMLLALVSAFGVSSAQGGERYIISTNGVQFTGMGRLIQQNSLGRLKVVHALPNLQLYVVEVPNDEAARELAILAGEGNLRKDTVIPLPVLPRMSREGQVGTDDFETPWGVKAVRAPEAWDRSTQGDGVKVAIIDTGIDRDHGSLKANFAAGKNFAELDEQKDYDYFDSYGHGTHVAGTIAADGSYRKLVGVAPKARIYSARVCSQGGCAYSDIYAGVDWGIENHVDVMNLSLGGPQDSMGQQVFNRAKQAGVTVIAAAGNESASEVSYPAGFDDVLAVGAVDSTLVKADFSNYGKGLDVVAPGVNVVSSVPKGTGAYSSMTAKVDNKSSEVAHSLMKQSLPTSPTLEGELVFAGLGKPAELDAAKVKGKIALIQRGEISFYEKAINAKNAGALGAIVFNNVDGALNGTLNTDLDFAVFGISKATGEQMQKGKWMISAMVYSKDDFAYYAGTSMASPHVAGVAALVKGANPNLTPDQIFEILKSTATDLKNKNYYGYGLVNAEAAVQKAKK